jgi:hypothetical protein
MDFRMMEEELEIGRETIRKILVKDPGKQYLHWVCSALFDR